MRLEKNNDDPRQTRVGNLRHTSKNRFVFQLEIIDRARSTAPVSFTFNFVGLAVQFQCNSHIFSGLFSRNCRSFWGW